MLPGRIEKLTVINVVVHLSILHDHIYGVFLYNGSFMLLTFDREILLMLHCL